MVDYHCLEQRINPFLRSLDLSAPESGNLDKIRRWMEAPDCVRLAELEDATLTTDPPMRAFYLTGDDDQRYLIVIVQRPKYWALTRFVHFP